MPLTLFIAHFSRAIMQNASGQAPLLCSVARSASTFLLRPHHIIFSKPFWLIVMLYGGTYMTANSVDTLSSTLSNKSASCVSSGTAKFAAASATNSCLSLIKDTKFVKLFGPSGPPRTVPLFSYALFSMRDCITIFASFNLPPLLGPIITRHMSAELQRGINGQTIAQFAAPATAQLLSTSLHLLGLDLYNRQDSKVSWHNRWCSIRKNWAISSAARICRILPAFGIGGVVNSQMRENLMQKLN